jgi:hypothetical protein
MGYTRHMDAVAKLHSALLESYESQLLRLAEEVISLLSASEIEALESDYHIDALSLKLARETGQPLVDAVRDHAQLARADMALSSPAKSGRPPFKNSPAPCLTR